MIKHAARPMELKMNTREDYLFAIIGYLRTNLVGQRQAGARESFLSTAARLRESQLLQLESIWDALPDRTGLTPPHEVLTWQ